MFSPKQLVEARKEKGFTRTDLLFALDKAKFRISHPTLYRWETGISTPNGDQISRLAKFFNKPEQYFFDQKHHTTSGVRENACQAVARAS